ncbi:hypothetical protein KUTeg_019817 [Tegillarca granosa]|uniref:Macrophage mannose receptor 1 n=1 Tax=Tegillarca granosa TaxID=220873 RepID=A0ABQ9EG72_TEGGR|nr:hypothetical protein KUTeg_019817 [Tegillarca granosa]
MVYLNSEEEQNYINSELRGLQSIGLSSVWIGLSRDVNGKWLLDFNCSSLKSFICMDEALTISRLTATTQHSTTISTTAMPTLTPIRGIITDPVLPNTQRPVITQRPISTQRSIPTEPEIIRTTISSPTIATTTLRPTTAVWSAQCGPNWEEDPNTHFCYQFNDDLRSWTQARATCVRHGGDLLSVTSIQEQYYIGGRIRNMISDAVWIGANTRADDKGWIWSDGSPFPYLNFAPGEPDNVDEIEECVNMDVRTTKWGDKPCNNVYGYICKKIGIVNATVSPYKPPPEIPEGKRYGCPANWTDYHSQCFKIVREKKTWLEARSYCRKIGGDLASIVDENEQNFILSQLPATHCYNLYHDEKCDQWAKTGECSKNPAWMKRHCHLSCGVCLRDCKNLHNGHQCDIWAKNRECSKNPKWMLQNCALSCGICDSAIHGGFWIGLHDRYMSNSFRWSNGDKVTFTNWAKREPNNIGRYGEDCVLTKLMGTYAYDAFCYSFFKNSSTWNAAENHCVSRNGHLATVNDRYVQAFLASLISDMPADVWIGLTDSLTPGTFESWTGGTSLQFTHWFKQHTGNEDGTCVAMRIRLPVGLWVNGNCTDSKPYVCEFPRLGFTIPTTITTPGVSSTTTELPKCYEEWVEYNDHCYKAFKGEKNKASWIDAREKCRKLGADLVSIHGIGEGAFIIDTFLSHWDSIWIGFSDRDIESTHQWSDGSIVDYTNWSPNEPNNYFGYEDCAELKAWDKQWNDNNCYKAKSFVCKVKRGTPVKTIDSSSQIAPDHCGEDTDWVFRNGYCYLIKKVTEISQLKNWYEAERFCNKNGGNLASIHNREDSVWYDENCGKELQGFVCKKVNGTAEPVTTQTAPIAPGGCAPHFFASPINSKCYKFGGLDVSEESDSNVDGPKTWHMAAKICKAYGNGYSLVSISDGIENAFLLSQMRNFSESFWIGLHDNVVNGKYMWQDNTEVELTKWAYGEPNGYSKEDKTFKDAQALCKIDNGNLIAIDDISEQAFTTVFTRELDKPFWIGLTRKQMYLYGQTNLTTVIETGMMENPQILLGVWKNSVQKWLWNDLDCNSKKPFVCKKPIGSITVSSPSSTEEETTVAITKAGVSSVTDQTVEISNISTNKTTKSVTSPPSPKPLQAGPDTDVQRSHLRAGHIIGIFIGVGGAIIIASAIIYVYRRLRPTGAYNTDQGFANAFLNRVYYGQSDNTELHFLRGVKCKEHLIKLENKFMSCLFQHFAKLLKKICKNKKYFKL